MSYASRLARGLAAPLVIVAAGLAWFGPMLSGLSYSPVPYYQSLVLPWRANYGFFSESWVQFDAAASGIPMWSFLRETLLRGDAPLWQPGPFLTGYPIATDGLSAYLYLPRVLLALLAEPRVAHDIFAVVNVVGGGFFALLFLRRTSGSTLGGLFGAVTWMFCGWSAAYQQFDMLAPAILLLPAALWAVDRAIHGASWVFVVLAGWVMGVTLLAGNIVDMMLVYWTAAAYAAGLTLFAARRSLFRAAGRPYLLRLLALGALSVACGAIGLIPTMLNVGQAARLPMTWETVFTSQTSPLIDYLGWMVTPPTTPLTSVELSRMVWIGPVAIGLALIGLLLGKGRLAWFGRVAVLAALGIATGGPLAWVVYQVLPPFRNLASYARLNVIISFALVALAVAGVALIQRELRAGRTALGPRRRRLAGAYAVGALLVANSVPLLTYAGMVNPPFLDPATYPSFPATAAGAALRRELTMGTTWPGVVIPVAPTRSDTWDGWPLADGTATMVGVDSAGGYDSLVPERIAAILRLLDTSDRGRGTTAINPRFQSADVRWDLLPRLGITAVYSTPEPSDPSVEDWGSLPDPAILTSVYDDVDGRVWRVPGSRPGPYVASSVATARSEAEALEIIGGASWPDGQVVLEPGVTGATIDPVKGGTGEVRSSGRGVNGAVVDVEASRATWLVVPISFDPGWSATVNGEAAPIVPANVSRIAVPIGAGSSHVELRYRPPGLLPGLALTVGAAFASTFILVSTVRSRRRQEVTDGTA